MNSGSTGLLGRQEGVNRKSTAPVYATLPRVDDSGEPTLRQLKSPARTTKTEVAPEAAPWEPTTERQAKEPYGFSVEQKPGGIASHQVRTAFDEHAGRFTANEVAIADQLLNDSDDATRVNIICSRTYTGMPYTGGGEQAGHISHLQREAHARFNWVMRHIDERFRAVIAALVLGLRYEATGKALSVEDIGRQASLWKDKATNKGVGVGLLKGALWRVGEAYKEYRLHEQRRKEAIEQLRQQQSFDHAEEELARVRRGKNGARPRTSE